MAASTPTAAPPTVGVLPTPDWARRLVHASPDLEAHIATLRSHDPNPGSDEAVEKGCTCDREANNDGDGRQYIWLAPGVVVFDIDDNCPLLQGDET